MVTENKRPGFNSVCTTLLFSQKAASDCIFFLLIYGLGGIN